MDQTVDDEVIALDAPTRHVVLLLLIIAAILLTLGIGWPWATVRAARFWCRHLTLEGAVDLAAIQQETQPASATGEGLLGLLEADLDMG